MKHKFVECQGLDYTLVESPQGVRGAAWNESSLTVSTAEKLSR